MTPRIHRPPSTHAHVPSHGRREAPVVRQRARRPAKDGIPFLSVPWNEGKQYLGGTGARTGIGACWRRAGTSRPARSRSPSGTPTLRIGIEINHYSEAASARTSAHPPPGTRRTPTEGFPGPGPRPLPTPGTPPATRRLSVVHATGIGGAPTGGRGVLPGGGWRGWAVAGQLGPGERAGGGNPALRGAGRVRRTCWSRNILPVGDCAADCSLHGPRRVLFPCLPARPALHLSGPRNGLPRRSAPLRAAGAALRGEPSPRRRPGLAGVGSPDGARRAAGRVDRRAAEIRLGGQGAVPRGGGRHAVRPRCGAGGGRGARGRRAAVGALPGRAGGGAQEAGRTADGARARVQPPGVQVRPPQPPARARLQGNPRQDRAGVPQHLPHPALAAGGPGGAEAGGRAAAAEGGAARQQGAEQGEREEAGGGEGGAGFAGAGGAADAGAVTGRTGGRASGAGPERAARTLPRTPPRTRSFLLPSSFFSFLLWTPSYFFLPSHSRLGADSVRSDGERRTTDFCGRRGRVIYCLWTRM